MQLRLPVDVHTALVAASEEMDRSLNGEIVSRLRATLKDKRKAPRETPTE
ncbi:Arc family DNA-binding protein [Variovorax sp. DAIF25]